MNSEETAKSESSKQCARCYTHKHTPVVDNAKGGREGTECECVQRAVHNTVRYVSLTDMPAKRQAVTTSVK